MYFRELASIIGRSHEANLVDSFDDWLAARLPAERKHLVPDTFARDVSIPVELADELFSRAVQVGVLRIRWVLVCPECLEVLESAYDPRRLPDADSILRCTDGHEVCRAENPDALRLYFELTHAPNRYVSKKGGPVLSQPGRLDRLAGNRVFQAIALDSELSDPVDPVKLNALLEGVRQFRGQTNQQRGKAMQAVAEYLMGLLRYCTIEPTINTETSELDLYVQLRGRPFPHSVLDGLAPAFNVECRNTSEPLGSQFIYGAVNRARCHNCAALVVFSRSGYSEPAYQVVREGMMKDNFPAMLINLENLERLARSEPRPFLTTLGDWYYAVLSKRSIP